MRPSEAGEVAEVHCEAFPGYSLTLLGWRFLKLYYEQLLKDQAGITLVATRDDEIAGFAAGAMNPQGFYARLFKRRWFAFMLAAIPGALRHPKLIPRLLQAPKYAGKLPAGEDLVTLSSIAVRSRAKGSGVGAYLMKEFIAKAKLRGATCVVWGTKKHDKAANRFYEKIGYSEVKQFRDTQDEEILEYYLQI